MDDLPIVTWIVQGFEDVVSSRGWLMVAKVEVSRVFGVGMAVVGLSGTERRDMASASTLEERIFGLRWLNRLVGSFGGNVKIDLVERV